MRSQAPAGNLAFLRASAGTFIRFDAPGAGTRFVQGTFVLALNPGGTTRGYYVDSSYAAHGSLRASAGTLTTFDAPSSTSTVALPSIRRGQSRELTLTRVSCFTASSSWFREDDIGKGARKKGKRFRKPGGA